MAAMTTIIKFLPTSGDLITVLVLLIGAVMGVAVARIAEAKASG